MLIKWSFKEFNIAQVSSILAPLYTILVDMYSKSRKLKTKAESGEMRGVVSKLPTTIMRSNEWSMKNYNRVSGS